MNARAMAVILCCLFATVASNTEAGDWPQWRGVNRDAKVTGFDAPATWPEKLTQKWKIPVGDGVATPSLVGDKLYVFSRQEGDEVIQCLDAASGQEVWHNKYETDDASGPAGNFPVLGPRSSPTVAEGKLVTLGTRGTLSCLNAANGDQVWRKDDIQSWPRFFVSSSPIVTDGVCIACLGGERDGAIVAYDLAAGNEKWKWPGDGPSYGSPVLATIGSTKLIIVPTAEKLVAVSVADGTLLWEIDYTQGRYNAATPIIEGDTLILAGPTRGITAHKLSKKTDQLVAEELWSNPDNSLMYNTPVLKNGLLFGLSNLNSLFCVNVSTGKTAWNAPISKNANEAGQPAEGGGRDPAAKSDEKKEDEKKAEEGKSDDGEKGQGRRKGRGGRGGRGGRRGGGGSGGYGSVVDAGNVLVALSPAAELVVFQPSEQGYNEVARYKVADGNTYSYPVISGKQIYVKDKDSITLWTLE